MANLYLSFVSCVVLFYISNAFVVQKPRPIVNFPAGVREKIRSQVIECMPKEWNTEEVLLQIKQGKYGEGDEFETFTHCAYSSTGYANPDGSIKLEDVSQLFPDPALMYKVLEKCAALRGNTPAKTVYLFYKCFQDVSPVLLEL